MTRLCKLRIGLPSFSHTIDRLCFIAFFNLVLAVLLRFWWLDGNDRNGCEALRLRGRWLDPLRSPEPSFRNWQPPGCMMHNYDTIDISSCLGFRKIVFIGDSTTRNIFWATAKKLDFQEAVRKKSVAAKHEDQTFSGAGVIAEFVWDPFLNSTRLREHLTIYRNALDLPANGQGENESPAILLLGAGLWHVRHLGSAYLTGFQASIENIISHYAPNDFQSNQCSFFQEYHMKSPDSIMLLAPVQIPAYKSLPPSLGETITPLKINALNGFLQNISSCQAASVVWSFNLMISNAEVGYDQTGIHVYEDIADRKSDVLLNMKCNSMLTGSKRYPMDKTCCSRYPRLNWVQLTTIAVAVGILPLNALLSIRESCQPMLSSPSKLSRAFSVLLLAMCYSFFADRTYLFSKAQKQYSSAEFKTLCLAVLAVGMLSIRRSETSSKGKPQPSGQAVMDQPFLSRDQTDEWKGWMQFLILIYHYTGASKVMPVYAVIRILVASYLFMTGYGHTVFFYKEGDFTLRRCASVLVRLNLLSVLLPYVMGTDYLFYYFAPLISFWYMAIYITMRMGKSRNASMRFLVGKIIVSMGVVTGLIRIPQIFEGVFAILRISCNIHWNVTEWRFRLQLDAYIVYVGMICGILFIKVTAPLQGNQNENRILHFLHSHWLQIRIGASIAAVMILSGFWLITQRASDKVAYNRWVPYLSWLPILSFITLRNLSHHTRNFYSSVFAWLGRHSLETFTLQFHIWLAADTKGLLALGVFGRHATYTDGRWADFVVLTTVFLWLSWHVATATGRVTSWIVDPRPGNSGATIEAAVSTPPMDLPRTKDDVSPETRAEGHAEEGYGVKLQRRASGWWMDGLKVRLATMVGILWVLNRISG